MNTFIQNISQNSSVTFNNLTISNDSSLKIYNTLIDNPVLEEVKITNTVFCDGCLLQSFKFLYKIKKISLHNVVASPKEIGQFIEHVLINNNLLQSLKVAHTKVDFDFANLSMLKHKLNFTTLKFDSVELNEKAVVDLAVVLTSTRSLKKLSLENCSLSKDAIETIANSLESNNTVTKLDFSNNKINSAEAIYLASMVRVNKTITSINLSKNNLRFSGTINLFRALKSNCTLSSLDLSQNNIENDPGEGFDFIREHPSLKSLDLSYNKITSYGIIKLATFLQSSKLEILSLAGANFDTAESIIKFAESLKSNKVLKCLSVKDCELFGNNLNPICEIFDENNTIVDFSISCDNLQHGTIMKFFRQLSYNENLQTVNFYTNSVDNNLANQFALRFKDHVNLTQVYFNKFARSDQLNNLLEANRNRIRN